MMRRIIGTLTGLLVLCCSSGARNFFVDGYHGGIYGHYPVQWKTQFIVDNLNAHPDWYVGLEIEPETWDTVQVRTPEAYAQFAALLKSGRMEYTNPAYAQPYCYNVMGESIIRQFKYGIDKLRSHFGDIEFNTYAVEEPCFTSALPAILKGFGFKYASLKCPNTCWGGYMAPYGGQLVEWVGPDGTSIVTVSRYGCEELEQNSVWQTTAWGNSKRYWNACRESGIENPVAMCYQDAGWRNGPWLGRHRGTTTYMLWTDYIEKQTPASSTDRYVMSQDDVRVNLMWGAQGLQRIARQVRHAENNMLMTEKMGALSLMCGGCRPDQDAVDEAWRQLMLAQHHDSWIVPYNGLWHFGTWADAIKLWTSNTDKAANQQFERMACSVDSGNVLMVKVFNTTLQPRAEVVAVDVPVGLLADGRSVSLTDYEGNIVPSRVTICNGQPKVVFAARVPSFGYATYNIKRIDADAPKYGDVVADKTVLENEHLRVALDLAHGGVVKSLMLKDNNKEFAPADTCAFALCELRGFFYEEGCFHSSAETVARVVEYDSDPLVNRVTVEGEIAGSPYRLTYSLPAGSKRVDCALTIDWKGNPGIGEYREQHWNHDRRAFCDDRYKLCLLLPTSFEAERLWKDAPFDVCESAQESTFFDRWSGIKHNVILDWIDFTDREATVGLGLISDHTTSYVHGPGYPTALTVQYTGQGLWGVNYKITEPTELTFALVPHCGTCGAEAVSHEADRFNEPLRAVACSGNGVAATRSLVDVDNEGYRISAAQAGDDGKLTLRLHNVFADSQAHVKLDTPFDSAAETDLLGNQLATVPVNARTMKVDMPRNGFRTYSLTTK